MAKNRFTPWQWVQLAVAEAISHLPGPWVSAIGHYLGQQVGRKAILDNPPWVGDMHQSLQQLKGMTELGDRQRAIIKWAGYAGRLRAEFLVLQKLVKAGRLEIIGLENLANLKFPIIFVSCHLGNWELLSYFSTLLPNRGADIYVPPIDPIQRYWASKARLAWQGNVDFIPASPRSAFQLIRALNQGHNLCLFIDEEKDGYIWGPSLGRNLPYGGNRWLAARLAVRHRVDIVPLVVTPIGRGRYCLTVVPKLEKGQGDQESQAKYLADQIDTIFNQWVRENLEHWHWLSWLKLDQTLPIRNAPR